MSLPENGSDFESQLNLFGLTPQRVEEVFTQEGVKGLTSRGLSDVDAIFALRRYCIGGPEITPTLVKAGWSRNQFITAEKNFGLDAESLARERRRFNYYARRLPLENS